MLMNVIRAERGICHSDIPKKKRVSERKFEQLVAGEDFAGGSAHLCGQCAIMAVPAVGFGGGAPAETRVLRRRFSRLVGSGLRLLESRLESFAADWLALARGH